MPFDLERPIAKEQLADILEAARWSPTAHNMQNFEIIVVDDRKILEAIWSIGTTGRSQRPSYGRTTGNYPSPRRNSSEKDGSLGDHVSTVLEERGFQARPDR